VTGTDVVPVADARPGMLTPNSYEDAWKLAARIAGTSFVPEGLRGDPNAVLAAILWGGEVGIGAIQALNGIDVIKGKVSPSAELMRALVLRAGHTLNIVESSAERCVIFGKRREGGGAGEMTVTWTLDDARRAGLTGGSGWQKYPRAMLLARASSEICRGIFSDAIAGLGYAPDETAEIVGGTWEPSEESAPVQAAPTGVSDDDEVIDAELVEDDDPLSADDLAERGYEPGRIAGVVGDESLTTGQKSVAKLLDDIADDELRHQAWRAYGDAFGPIATLPQRQLAKAMRFATDEARTASDELQRRAAEA